MALFRSVARPRSPRQRWHMATCARKTRNKTHHARSGGATGGPWCVLLRVSRARSCGQRRHRRARMYIGPHGFVTPRFWADPTVLGHPTVLEGHPTVLAPHGFVADHPTVSVSRGARVVLDPLRCRNCRVDVRKLSCFSRDASDSQPSWYPPDVHRTPRFCDPTVLG